TALPRSWPRRPAPCPARVADHRWRTPTVRSRWPRRSSRWPAARCETKPCPWQGNGPWRLLLSHGMRCGTGAVNRAESQAGAQGAAQGFSAVVRDAAGPDGLVGEGDLGFGVGEGKLAAEAVVAETARAGHATPGR